MNLKFLMVQKNIGENYLQNNKLIIDALLKYEFLIFNKNFKKTR